MNRRAALGVLIAGLAAAPAPGCGGPTPETLKLIRAITEPESSGAKLPRVPFLAMSWLQQELNRDRTLQPALDRLAVERTPREKADAVETLRARRSIGGLLTALHSPSADVRILAARGLATVLDSRANPSAVRVLIRLTQSAAVWQQGSEEATLHGAYQQALADTLNRLTGSRVQLKQGQDPEGLQAGIPVWEAALARQLPAQ